jgi:hypothetical protein
LHEFEDDLRDSYVAVPLVVGGDDEPRGVFAAGGGEDVVVGVHVLGPQLSLANVGIGELPVFFLVVDTGLEAAGLLFARDVKVELKNEHVVVGKHALELVDIFKALIDDVNGDDFVDSGPQDVLVVGAVEDADHAAGRDLLVDSPEEVVAGLEGRGDFELGDVAALGIYAREDVADGAIFACGVHTLEDDEEGLGLAGVEDVLKIRQLAAVFGEGRFGCVFGFEVARVGGRDFRQPYFGVRLNEIRRFNLHEARPARSRLRKKANSEAGTATWSSALLN